MFGLLKNKISSFINAVAGAAKEKAETGKETATPEPAQEKPLQEQPPEEKIAETPAAPETRAPERAVETAEAIKTTPLAETVVTAPRVTATPSIAATEVAPHTPTPRPVHTPATREPRPERNIAPHVGVLARVKSLFTQEIEIGEREATPLLEELETALLESDVSLDTTQQLVQSLRGKIVGMKTSPARVGESVRQAVRESLAELFAKEPFDFYNYVAAKKAGGKPAVVLMLGPNGAGKTTTIAKLCSQLQKRGFTSIIAAGDTFRKAAIEQAQLHGDKLGVRVVKHGYGADPAAVAFDAIAAAKASGVNVVLVDTAGRQETNINLVKEMQKIDRVVKPDLKLFVGEAVAGNALASQIRKFHEAVKLDGIILTKLDCDAKGGGAFTIAFETKLPIIMVGTGQSYEDLRPFDADWVIDNVFAA